MAGVQVPVRVVPGKQRASAWKVSWTENPVTCVCLPTYVFIFYLIILIGALGFALIVRINKVEPECTDNALLNKERVLSTLQH